MDENILRLRVGIFVLIAMIILAILVILNSEGWVSQYTVIVKPFSAPGVTVGTPIRKNGILIGRVRSVTPEDGYVTLELAVNDNIKLYANEEVSIGAESILGDSVVEFIALPIEQRGNMLAEGDNIRTFSVKADLMKTMTKIAPQLAETLETLQGAARSIDEAGQGVNRLTNQLNQALSDESSELKGLITDFRDTNLKAQVAIDNFNRIFDNANSIIGDPEFKGRIKQALAEVPEIFKEIRETIADTRATVNKFQDIPNKVTGTLDGLGDTFENLEVFSAALKADGPEVVAQLKTSLKNIDTLVADVKNFTGSLGNLKDSKGTLGKLLNDPELYDTAMQAMEKINEQVARIEPIVNDVRVFTDKIAREPGQLGVSGAIKGFSNKQDYKGSAGRDGGLFGGRTLR